MKRIYLVIVMTCLVVSQCQSFVDLNLPEQEQRDLDEYVAEVNRLLGVSKSTDSRPVDSTVFDPMKTNPEIVPYDDVSSETDLTVFDPMKTNPEIVPYGDVSSETNSTVFDPMKTNPEIVPYDDVSSETNSTVFDPMKSNHEIDLYDDVSSEFDFTVFGAMKSESEIVPYNGVLSETDLKSFTVETSTDENCLGSVNHKAAIFKLCIYKQSGSVNPHEQQVTSNSTTKALDSKFLKYCSRAPQLRTCIKSYVLAEMTNCLDEGVRETIENINEITTQLIRFICRNEVDRISLFINDGGVECLDSNKQIMLFCLTRHLGQFLLGSVFDLPSIFTDGDKCNNINTAQECVHRRLNACEDQTAANIVWLMFDIGKEVASCGGYRHGRNTTQSAEDTMTTELPGTRNEEEEEYATTTVDDFVSSSGVTPRAPSDTSDRLITLHDNSSDIQILLQLNRSGESLQKSELKEAITTLPSSSISNRITLCLLIIGILLTVHL